MKVIIIILITILLNNSAQMCAQNYINTAIDYSFICPSCWRLNGEEGSWQVYSLNHQPLLVFTKQDGSMFLFSISTSKSSNEVYYLDNTKYFITKNESCR